MKTSSRYLLFPFILLVVLFTAPHCKKDEPGQAPVIRLIFDNGCAHNGDTVEVGRPIRFRVEAIGADANLTNFTVKKITTAGVKTVLDSGMNSQGFTSSLTFYQGVEEKVEWKLSVMDRERKEASVSLFIHKDPNSHFGGIHEFPLIRIGYQSNTQYGHFLLPLLNKVLFADSAILHQSDVDLLVYFNFSEDNGVLKPSPTFSSPGETSNGSGDLYTIYYPSLSSWTQRNYTKYDIRAVNGVTALSYDNAHNDSLLIVSYDDVWGKKKYKWAGAGMFIPFQTESGKKGILKILSADNTETGSIAFSLKIQM